MADDKTTETDRVSRLFSEWRSQRVRGVRIPEHLWVEAHTLAKSIGITAASRVLRLNGSTLKEHGQRLDPDHKDSEATQKFVELSTPTSLYQEPSSTTTLEIEQGCRRLTFRFDHLHDERLIRFAHRLLEQA
jgi:hypothetical protein